MDFTKYEVARLIGARALQLSCGAPPMIKVSTNKSFIEIAYEELEKSVISLTVIRESF
ncbi:DNA-directed RNA polymerase subunit K [Candidatus Micrarchaeota archaeon]|nr:DNA-directed RNA polymerase subunit K [Candidatus Micrarchaeota archaeon]